MQTISNLSKEIILTPVCNEGYTDRDMSSYYGNTFLMHDTGDSYSVVFCEGCDLHSARCAYLNEDGDFDTIDLPLAELYRFTPQQGFYCLRRNNLPAIIEYSLPTTRSYKKGINRDLVKISRLEPSGRLYNTDGLRSQVLALMHICSEPEERTKTTSFLISRRLAVVNGKIYSVYQKKTVGSYADGILTTPFVSIIDRVSELHGDIKCQLQQL